jgi:ABC-type dipeptide/oligopeptide/nickel transport system permease component
MTLLRFVLHRLAFGIGQLVALGAALYFLIRLLPADPVAHFVGLNASAQAYALAQHRLGLDLPLWQQFAQYIGLTGTDAGLLQGNLGQSWVTGTAVASDLRAFLPVTLELVSYSFLLALAVGVPLGILGAVRPGGLVDKGTLFYSLFAGSQPEFTWGLLFIYIFFVVLGVAPGPIGRLSPLTQTPEPITGALTVDALLRADGHLLLEALHYLMLPVAVLAFVLSGPIIKTVRENMAQALRSDWVLYQRAAGLPERRIAWNAFRVAFAPALTLVGVLYAFMLGGAVLVENIFSLGGLGQYATRSILAFDYPAIQGAVLAITAVSLLVYLLIDVIHALLDPRITQ